MDSQTPGTEVAEKPNQAVANPEEVQRAREMTGEKKPFMPFVPTLRVNSLWGDKEVDDQKVKVQPEKFFILNQKNEESGEFETSKVEVPISGVILKYRNQIIKFKQKVEGGYTIDFKSKEFDSDVFINRSPIVLYRNMGKPEEEIVAEGSYQELCKLYETGEKNSFGKPRKSFSLTTVIYLWIGSLEKGKLVKIEAKTKKDLIDYRNSFGEDETHVGVETMFDLEWRESQGEAKDRWDIVYTRGEPVNLGEYLTKVEGLVSALNILSSIKAGSSAAEGEIVEEQPAQEAPPSEEIQVEQIPF